MNLAPFLPAPKSAGAPNLPGGTYNSIEIRHFISIKNFPGGPDPSGFWLWVCIRLAQIQTYSKRLTTLTSTPIFKKKKFIQGGFFQKRERKTEGRKSKGGKKIELFIKKPSWWWLPLCERIGNVDAQSHSRTNADVSVRETDARAVVISSRAYSRILNWQCSTSQCYTEKKCSLSKYKL